MTKYKEKVKSLCDLMYSSDYTQIVIDLVQEEIEPLLIEEMPTRDSIGSAGYQTSIISDVMNPKFEADTKFLKEMYEALNDWENDIEQTNVILGLPKET